MCVSSCTSHIYLFLYFKDCTQTSENNLPPASTINIIRSSKKIHRHLEMLNNDSIKSCPICSYDILAFLAIFQRLEYSKLLQQIKQFQILCQDKIQPYYATIHHSYLYNLFSSTLKKWRMEATHNRPKFIVFAPDLLTHVFETFLLCKAMFKLMQWDAQT